MLGMGWYNVCITRIGRFGLRHPIDASQKIYKLVKLFMVNKFKKGFTLIELLVVIAIIGILAAIIIANLGGARNVAKDGAVKSQLANMRAQAELYAQGYGNVYSDGAVNSSSDCAIADSMFDSTRTNSVTALLEGIDGSGGVATCFAGPSVWAVSSTLPSGANAWCVDSAGQSKEGTATATGCN